VPGYVPGQLCKICGLKIDPRIGFIPSTPFSPISTIPPLLHSHTILITTLVRSTSGTMHANINHLTPNGHFSGRTAPLTYRCCIFYLFNKYTY
jgi:hypothetical protein